MEINNATATSVAQLVNNKQPQPQASVAATNNPVSIDPSAQSAPSQNSDSTVVKLSAQAQQMNRAEQNVGVQRAEIRPQEVAEPPGIQFMAGDDAGRNINTYA